MPKRIKYNNILVSKKLDEFVKKEMLKGLNINPENFWQSFNKIIEKFTPLNNLSKLKQQMLIKKLQRLQGHN